MKFHPLTWNAMYEEKAVGDTAFPFVRGSRLVANACVELCEHGERWLDIGCGGAFVATRLAARGVLAVGIDHDPAMTLQAHARNPQKATPAAPLFLNADACALPFGSATINGIVAVSLTGCLPSFNDFAREAHRVLRRNGFAVLTFTNQDSPLLRSHAVARSKVYRRVRQLGARFSVRENRPDLAEVSGCRTYTSYKAPEVVAAMHTIGFSIRRLTYYNYYTENELHIFPAPRVAAALERLDNYEKMRRWGRNFLVVLQKN